jgi:nucleoside-diphosphate-sugar epimerase
MSLKRGKKVAFVTGGGGYVGVNLAAELEQNGFVVVLADVKFPPVHVVARHRVAAEKIQLDICDREAVAKELEHAKPDVVFHIASYGMSGKEQFNKKLIEAVNIQGTRNVLNGCVEHGVECIVYTSTYNVVFGGQVIENGDESLPYFPVHKHVDHYSRTKSLAEQEVMEYNDRVVKGGGRLKVCALRLAGIYGVGEQRHFPRIVSLVEMGLYKFTVGHRNTMADFVHINNLIQAHRLAGEALLTPHSVAAGQVYNICDGSPVNSFEFLRPLVEGLGYTHPWLPLPVSIAYYIAYVTEGAIKVLQKFGCGFQPMLTRAEVFKVGVTHYFRLDKAKKDLKYRPQKYDMEDIVRWFREKGHERTFRCKKSSYTYMYMIIISILIGVILYILVGVLL